MASTTPDRRSWTRWLIQRWPTALAVGLTALTLGGSESEEVAALSEWLLLLPLLYLVVAKVQRRQASWPLLVVLAVPFIALQATDLIAPPAFPAAVALIVLVWGAIDGQLHRLVARRRSSFGVEPRLHPHLAALLVAYIQPGMRAPRALQGGRRSHPNTQTTSATDH